MKESPAAAERETRLVRLAAEFAAHWQFAVEETGDTLDSQVLAISTTGSRRNSAARIAFRILLSEPILRFEDGFRDDVLGSDQLDFMALAAEFQLDRLGISDRIGEPGREKEFALCGCDSLAHAANLQSVRASIAAKSVSETARQGMSE